MDADIRSIAGRSKQGYAQMACGFRCSKRAVSGKALFIRVLGVMGRPGAASLLWNAC